MIILAGDVGGTNTRLNLYELNDALFASESQKKCSSVPGELIYSKKYMNQDYETFLCILQDFLISSNSNSLGNRNKIRPSLHVGCIAVAGPVDNNVVELTNRNWPPINGSELATHFNFDKILIINDFMAMGYGLLTLDHDKECKLLQNGINTSKNELGAIACIGAGTGLGECYLTPSDTNLDLQTNDKYCYTCFPSEGGHAEFSPRNEEEIGLQNYLKKLYEEPNRVSIERVVSGPGMQCTVI